MISLLQTATEMERLEALQSATAEAYKFAIRSVAQYAVQLDAADAAEFRSKLEALAKSYDQKPEPSHIRLIQASFRGDLRDYRDQASARIDRLRKDVEAAAAAMSALAGSVSSHAADHEAKVKNELEHLSDIGSWNDLGEIRRGIQGVIAGVEEAMEQMQAANRLMTAQLQDEIRMLHQDIESKQRALVTDAETGAWNCEKSHQRLAELLEENEAFLVLLISVKNLRRLQGRFSNSVVSGALKALTKRLRTITGDGAPVGRLTDTDFIVFLDADPVSAISLSRDASAQLSGSYAIQEAGFAKMLVLEVATGVCERAAAMDPAAFRKKLDQLSTALAHS